MDSGKCLPVDLSRSPGTSCPDLAHPDRFCKGAGKAARALLPRFGQLAHHLQGVAHLSADGLPFPEFTGRLLGLASRLSLFHGPDH